MAARPDDGPTPREIQERLWAERTQEPFLVYRDGDGFYASYFGLDSAGRVVALVTDFGVVEWRAGT